MNLYKYAIEYKNAPIGNKENMLCKYYNKDSSKSQDNVETPKITKFLEKSFIYAGLISVFSINFFEISCKPTKNRPVFSLGFPRLSESLLSFILSPQNVLENMLFYIFVKTEENLMMTEAEFKLHMSVYLDTQIKPLLREISYLEQRLNKLEALVKGDISPAFPFAKVASPSPQIIDKDDTDDAKKTAPLDLTEEYLKPIHENVLIIKNFIDEYRITAADRNFLKLKEQSH